MDKQTNKQTLRKFKKDLLINNYKKIIIDNEIDKPILHLNDINESKYHINYFKEINKVSSNILEKEDIINLKKYANFYKYWLDLKKQTITIGSKKMNIYKIKNCIYFKDYYGNIINANKEFKLAKEMNRIKPSEIIMGRIKECEIIRNKYKVTV